MKYILGFLVLFGFVLLSTEPMMIPNLQMRKIRPIVLKYLVQGHRASKV